MIDCLRERRHVEGKGWVYDNNTDTRRIRCLRCGEVFLTETKLYAVERKTESKRLKINLFHASLFDQAVSQ